MYRNSENLLSTDYLRLVNFQSSKGSRLFVFPFLLFSLWDFPRSEICPLAPIQLRVKFKLAQPPATEPSPASKESIQEQHGETGSCFRVLSLLPPIDHQHCCDNPGSLHRKAR